MSEYYILITNAGSAREAEAHANGETVNLSHFGICDGGVDFVPDHTATGFENEVYRGAISSLTVSEADDTILVAKCIIPAASGGYTVRGIAIYTDDGLLYATGNYPNQEKPLPETGFSASLEINAEMAVSHTSDITLVVPDDAFLTPPQADLLYLRQDKHLAEIAAQGAAAQEASRVNIGCGTAAAANVEDFLSADYTPPASGVSSVNGKTGAVQLGAGDVGAVPVTGGTMTGELVINVDDGAVRLKAKSSSAACFIKGTDPANANHWYIGAGSKFSDEVAWLNYKGGNNSVFLKEDGTVTINPAQGKAVSVTGKVVPTDYANFDARYLTQSAANSTFVQGIQFGAQTSHSVSDNKSFSTAGYSLTGYFCDGNNDDLDTLYAKPLQVNVNGIWKTISG